MGYLLRLTYFYTFNIFPQTKSKPRSQISLNVTAWYPFYSIILKFITYCKDSVYSTTLINWIELIHTTTKSAESLEVLRGLCSSPILSKHNKNRQQMTLTHNECITRLVNMHMIIHWRINMHMHIHTSDKNVCADFWAPTCSKYS